MFFADMLNICDPVLAFDELMEEVNIKRYLPERPYGKKGRPGYNRVNMLKTVLFGFMEHGYAALRTPDDDCKVNLRYMYLMDWETPSYGAFGSFIREELQGSMEEIFQAVNARTFEKEQDYMGNDQLLPAYNIRIGVADEYIAVMDVQQYRSDMDCFVPLMEKFQRQYGFYPNYPVADAGYGSYNNYLYCREHDME